MLIWKFLTSYIGYAYWAGIFLLGFLYRLCSWVPHHWQRNDETGPESHGYHSTGPWYRVGLGESLVNWAQTHLIPAPLAGRGWRLMGCIFTTPAEAFVVVGFWILSVILSVVGYRTFSGNI